MLLLKISLNFVYLLSNSCISNFNPPTPLTLKKISILLCGGKKLIVCVNWLSDLVWKTSFDQITFWTNGLWLGWWMDSPGTLGFSSFLSVYRGYQAWSHFCSVPLSHLAQEGSPRRGHCSSFLSILTLIFSWMNAHLLMACFSDTNKRSRILELFQ